ncbi:MAG: type IV pilus secretin PilQ, partial [Gammaproteobacteria bacterium]|nr:type IV pilus secretin PilQ [Gammaproteobacteria bacterium]
MSTQAKPAALVLEFPDTNNSLPWSMPLPVGIGLTQTIETTESGNTTRVFIKVSKLPQYTTRVEGSNVLVTVLDKALPDRDAAKHSGGDDEPVVPAKSNTGSKQPKALNIENARFTALPGEQAQIRFSLSDVPEKPANFVVDNPPRIVLDFANTNSKLSYRNRNIGVGVAKSLSILETGGRLRTVISLSKQVPYETRVEGNDVVLTLAAATETRPGKSAEGKTHRLEQVDFRRGDAGEGRVVVTLSDASTVVDLKEEGGQIIVDFINTKVAKELEQRLDVTDFATPTRTIDTRTDGDNVRLIITAAGHYEHLAYQSENTFALDIKPVSDTERGLGIPRKEFEGEKLSLNFQDIEVRSVLQLLADFTGINIIVSDTVKGNITLRLKNVPWDQALDIILKTKGLVMRQNGSVMLVAPGDEVAAREKLELEANKQIQNLAPLHSDLVQINYARAQQIADLLKTEKNSLLSERGSVTVDERTNTLLVRDNADRLVEIRKLVAKLDIPVRQVLIESRIVIANDNFARDLGVRFGTSTSRASGANQIAVSGSLAGNSSLLASTPTTPGIGDRLNVNLPVSSATGRFALSVLSASGSLLDLELSALQAEGRGEVVSSPRVITANQSEASIVQGTEIPYQQQTSSGATSVAFKQAVLSLKVKPQITPDDRIILKLHVSKDSVGTV